MLQIVGLRRYRSTARNDFAVYWEKDARALIAELKSANRGRV
jgi:hypothetical protein